MTEEQTLIIQKIYKITHFAADWYEIPVDRLRAHLWQESSWDRAGTDTHVVSWDGGNGIAQVEKGVHPFASDPSVFDIGVSVMWAAWFLANLLAQNKGDWEAASAAYNGSGPAAQEYAQKIGRWIQEKPWMEVCRAAGLEA